MATHVDDLQARLNAPPGPFRVAPAPADGATVSTNPPVFVWPPLEGVNDFLLEYSRDPDFPGTGTLRVELSANMREERVLLPWAGLRNVQYSALPTTIHAPDGPLPAGTWHWRYGCRPAMTESPVFGRTRSFVVASDARIYPIPAIEDVIPHVASFRPRLICGPEDIACLQSSRDEQLAAAVDRLVTRAHGHPGGKLLPESVPSRHEGEDGDSERRVRRRMREEFLQGAEDCALSYLITADGALGLEAVRRLMHVAAWDPEGATSLGENEAEGKELVRALPGLYDAVQELLTDEQRHTCLQAFIPRLRQVCLALRSRPFEVNPFESHAAHSWLCGLTEGCLAMAGDVDVGEWLGYCLLMLSAPFDPPFGGEDGGWSEGPNYWTWSVQRMLAALRVAERSTGIRMRLRGCLLKTGYFKFYSNPPYAKMSPFGNGQSEPTVGGPVMWELAMLLRNRHFKWYADQLGFAPSMPTELLRDDPEVTPEPPVALPQARCFWDVNLACMHSHVADRDHNVQVLLRSSPFGSISHSYADQNASIVHGYGEPLVIASGHYPYYGSPHMRGWSKQTKASNSIVLDGRGQPPDDWNAQGRVASFDSDDYCHYV